MAGEVFDQDDTGLAVLVENPGVTPDHLVRLAVELCPAQAISVIDPAR